MDRTSDDLDAFEEVLRDALAKVADPFYRPPVTLWQQLGWASAPSATHLRQRVQEAIQQLRPAADVPKATRAWRMYELLVARYVEELTQKETALRLGVTVRHLRREQQLAVRLLAQRLLEQTRPQDAPLAPQRSPDDMTEASEHESARDSAWREEVRAEWSRLQATAESQPGALREAIVAARELTRSMAPLCEVEVAVADDLLVACHASILRQLFLAALEKLIQRLPTVAVIRVYGEPHGDAVEMEIAGSPVADAELPDSDFIREVLALHQGELQVAHRQDEIVLTFALPLIRRQSVLLVDDNPDLVHLYRRFVEGTRFEIVHIDRGEGMLALAMQLQPVAVVLDIMLPDVDGWDLLQGLQSHAVTSEIPVVICSVIRREELARALGASALLAKPVRRQEFLATLERIARR